MALKLVIDAESEQQIKTLIKEALVELEQERTGLTPMPPPVKAAPPSEEHLARARRNMRRFGRGA